MVGKFLLGMVSGGLLVTGGLVIGSVFFPSPPANDNRPKAEAAEPIKAPEATEADAGAKSALEEPEVEAAEAAPAEAIVPEVAATPAEEAAPVEPVAEPEAEPTAEPLPTVEAEPSPAVEPEPEPAAQPEVAEANGGLAAPEGEAVATPELDAPAVAEVAEPVVPANPPKPDAALADTAAEASEAPEATVAPVPQEAAIELAEPEVPVEPAADPEPAAETSEPAPADEAAPVQPVVEEAEAAPPAVEPVVVEAPEPEPKAEEPVTTEAAPEEEAPAEAPATEAPPVVEAPAEAAPVEESEPEVALVEAPPAVDEPVVPVEVPVDVPVEEVPVEEVPVEVPVEEAPVEPTPAVDDTLPGSEASDLPGTNPDTLPDAESEAPEAVAPAEEEGTGSTFKPAPSLIEKGEGVITDRGTGAEEIPTEIPAADGAVLPADTRPIAQFATKFENPESKPAFAIVLIDTGSPDLDRPNLAALPFPVSFALDPLDPATPERAAIYRAAGREVVMLVTGIAEGAQASDVEVAFQSMEQGLPEAVAVMDLVEPAFQNNRPLASAVIPILKAQGRGLLTWDEGLNAADQVARRDDLEAAVVFRDLGSGGADRAAVRRLLDRAVFKAGQDGRVSVVGEANAETVAALLEWTVEGKAATVALAPLTAVLTVE